MSLRFGHVNELLPEALGAIGGQGPQRIPPTYSICAFIDREYLCAYHNAMGAAARGA